MPILLLVLVVVELVELNVTDACLSSLAALYALTLELIALAVDAPMGTVAVDRDRCLITGPAAWTYEVLLLLCK